MSTSSFPRETAVGPLAPAAEAVPVPVILETARSTHWQARQWDLRLQALTVAALNGVNSGVLKLSEPAEQPAPADCSAIVALSDLAFVLIARLNALTAHVMDLHEVTLEQVNIKLAANQGLITELVERLQAAEQPELARTLREALSPARFEEAQDLFAELKHCAATLLSLKCRIAGLVDGEAPGEWPPRAPADKPRASGKRTAR